MISGIKQFLRIDEASVAMRGLDRASEVVANIGGAVAAEPLVRQRALHYTADKLGAAVPAVAASGNADIVAGLELARQHLDDVRKAPGLTRPVLADVGSLIDGPLGLLRRSRSGPLDAGSLDAIAEVGGATGLGAMPQSERDVRLGLALLPTALKGVSTADMFPQVTTTIASRFAELAGTNTSVAEGVQNLAAASSSDNAAQRYRAVLDLSQRVRSTLGESDSMTQARLVTAAPKQLLVGARDLSPDVLRRTTQMDVLHARVAATPADGPITDELHVAGIAASLGALPDDALAMLARADATPEHHLAVAQRLLRIAGGTSVDSIDGRMGRQAVRELADMELGAITAPSQEVAAQVAQMRAEAAIPESASVLERASRIVGNAKSGDALGGYAYVGWSSSGGDTSPALLGQALSRAIGSAREGSPAAADTAEASVARLAALPPGMLVNSWFDTTSQALATAAKGDATPAANVAGDVADAVAGTVAGNVASSTAVIDSLAGGHDLIGELRDARVSVDQSIHKAQEASDNLIRGIGSKIQAKGALKDLRSAIEHLDAIAGKLDAAGAPVAAAQLRTTSIRLDETLNQLERYGRNVSSESKVIKHGTAGRRLADIDYVAMLASGELAGAHPALDASTEAAAASTGLAKGTPQVALANHMPDAI